VEQIARLPVISLCDISKLSKSSNKKVLGCWTNSSMGPKKLKWAAEGIRGTIFDYFLSTFLIWQSVTNIPNPIWKTTLFSPPLYFSTPIFQVFWPPVTQRAIADRPDSSQKASWPRADGNKHIFELLCRQNIRSKGLFSVKKDLKLIIVFPI
jgi:hypothetical protein